MRDAIVIVHLAHLNFQKLFLVYLQPVTVRLRITTDEVVLYNVET